MQNPMRGDDYSYTEYRSGGSAGVSGLYTPNRQVYSSSKKHPSQRKRLDEIESLLCPGQRQTPLPQRNLNEQSAFLQRSQIRKPLHYDTNSYLQGQGQRYPTSQLAPEVPAPLSVGYMPPELPVAPESSGLTYVESLEQEVHLLTTQYERACGTLVRLTVAKDITSLSLQEAEKRATLWKDEVDDRATLLSNFTRGGIGQMGLERKKEKKTFELKKEELKNEIHALKGELKALQLQKQTEQTDSKEAIKNLEAALSAQNQKIASLLESIPSTLQAQMEKINSQSVSPKEETTLEERIRLTLQSFWKEKKEHENDNTAKKTPRELFPEMDRKTATDLMRRFADTISTTSFIFETYCRQKNDFAHYEIELIRLMADKKESVMWQSMYEEKRSEVRHLEENVRLLNAEVKLLRESGATIDTNYKGMEKPFIPTASTSPKTVVPLRSMEQLKKEAFQLGVQPAQSAPVVRSHPMERETVGGGSTMDSSHSMQPVSTPAGAEGSSVASAPKLQIKQIVKRVASLSSSSLSSSSKVSPKPSVRKDPVSAPAAATAPSVKKIGSGGGTKGAVKKSDFDVSSDSNATEKKTSVKRSEKKTLKKADTASSSSISLTTSTAGTPAKSKPTVKSTLKKKFTDSLSSLSDSSDDAKKNNKKKKSLQKSVGSDGTPKTKNSAQTAKHSFLEEEDTPKAKKKTAKRSSFDEDTPKAKKGAPKRSSFDEDTPKAEKKKKAPSSSSSSSSSESPPRLKRTSRNLKRSSFDEETPKKKKETVKRSSFDEDTPKKKTKLSSTGSESDSEPRRKKVTKKASVSLSSTSSDDDDVTPKKRRRNTATAGKKEAPFSDVPKPTTVPPASAAVGRTRKSSLKLPTW